MNRKNFLKILGLGATAPVAALKGSGKTKTLKNQLDKTDYPSRKLIITNDNCSGIIESPEWVDYNIQYSRGSGYFY